MIGAYGSFNDVYILDLDDGTTRMETKEQSSSTNIGHTTATIRLSHHEEKKAITNGGNGSSNIREWYHPNISGVYPAGRWAHSSVVLQHQLFIFGGYNGTHCFDDVHVYDSGMRTSFI